jgi:hypothetical protein
VIDDEGEGDQCCQEDHHGEACPTALNHVGLGTDDEDDGWHRASEMRIRTQSDDEAIERIQNIQNPTNDNWCAGYGDEDNDGLDRDNGMTDEENALLRDLLNDRPINNSPIKKRHKQLTAQSPTDNDMTQ